MTPNKFTLMVYVAMVGTMGDYQTVVTACRGELDSTLPTINSQTEQDFLNQMIVKYKIIENVWLDAGIKNKHIVWADSSSGEYENWRSGSPVNNSNCVEMVPDQGNVGKWQDVPCAKKNSYVCKRVVMWSGQRTERLIRDNRRLLEGALNIITILTHNQDKHETEITMLKQSQVPIGFIYVQLPGQIDPKTLWPEYTWSDSTSPYAGQFFRAEGNGSLEFGKGVQNENAPRLSAVEQMDNADYGAHIDVTPGTWSKYIWSGYNPENKHTYSHRFYETGGEIRTRNQAVRLFKRLNKLSCFVGDLTLDDVITKMTKLEQKLAQHQSKISIGFIYVQLPDQVEPTSLWPTYTWSDVTANYAGDFFRAEGKGSLAFGTGAQAQSGPRLSAVYSNHNVSMNFNINITAGVWSDYIYTGGDSKTVLDEVRPPKLITSDNVCDDWSDIFHDDYYDICYKYYSGVADYHKMVKECNALNDSSLPTINTKAEQDFLINMMIKYKMVESVWLDASIKDKHIVWSDRSSGEYENWMSGRPVNNDNCVEMLADEVNRGKWEDQPCTKLNGYICKRVVMWSDQETARLIRDERRSLDAEIRSGYKCVGVEMIPDQGNIGKWQDIACAKKNSYLCKRVVIGSDQRTERLIRDNRRLLNEALQEISQLKQNQVPIGFTYVQLPNQDHPTKLWPTYKWSDVTATYAGQFFRAEGSGSCEFEGGIQTENAPRLSQIQRMDNEGHDPWTINVSPNAWSPWIFTGQDGGGHLHYLRFYETGGEVRPRNQAVRIFKRINL
ncbi:unnamed protein product [Medioppia subpectinata]|uniref:C-type lectin domain-containing protein n=1 Tax=Medioppia subpectinata TaxID=1979941 RepID=A0A7R9KIL1_9ACAR|nr:unnamed protein product [Medioppia subpectinata]CAG2104018.1 unnamed protein product [Medioppia subpectinata]